MDSAAEEALGIAREWRAVCSRLDQLGSWWRITRARAAGATVGEGCRAGRRAEFAPGNSFARRGRIVLGPRSELSAGCLLHPFGGSIRLGENVYLGPGTIIYGHGGVEIGDQTLVAMHCRILSSNHTVPPRNVLIRSQPDVCLPTRIGRDVWLGAGVTVLGGVTIGDGCVVGAGAVVTKDLAAGSVAAGIPARVTSRRLD